MLERKRHIIIRVLLTNFITIMLPALITLIYSVPAVKEVVKATSIQYGIHSYLKDHQVFIAIIAVVVIPGATSFLTYKKQFDNEKTTENILIALLAHLDTVVSVKNKRFYDYSKQVTKARGSAVFKEITQPILQIQEIIKNISSFFEHIKSDTTIKCSLLRVKPNNTIEHFICLDGQPTADDSIINQKSSTASNCLQTKSMVVVENTDKKDALFAHAHGATSSNKSIICYPIKKGKQVEFIISITSRMEKCFNNAEIKKYEYILEQFGKRIVLESYLNQIKETINA